MDGYLVGEINKQLSSKAGVDDEGARGLQAEKDWKAVWVCFTCCEQRQTDSDSAIQEEPLPTGLDRTRARETSWVLICRVWVSLWNRTWGHKWEPCLKVSLFTSISIDLCTLPALSNSLVAHFLFLHLQCPLSLGLRWTFIRACNISWSCFHAIHL